MKINISFYLFMALFFFASGKAWAASMENPSYKLELPSFNTTSGSSSGPLLGSEEKMLSKGSEHKAGINYTLEKGFGRSDKDGRDLFSLTISSSRIEFGSLSPGEPILRPLEVQVVNGHKVPFHVSIFQDHPLRTLTNAEIPDTTCDNASCSETTAAIWDIPLTYGFGYSCESNQNVLCSPDFTNVHFYRQIANYEKGESPNHFMYGGNGTFKVKGLFKDLKLNKSS